MREAAVVTGRQSVRLVRDAQQRLAGRRSLRLLGLDVGMRRIGLASANDDLVLVSSLGFVTYAKSSTARNRLWVTGHGADNMIGHASVFSSISQICQERRPDVLVVGYPYERNGSEGASCQAVRHFVAGLLAWQPGRWPRPTPVFWDEHFTSVMAYSNRYLLLGKASRIGDATLDADAAALMLQSFLDAMHAAPGVDSDYNGLDGESIFSEHLEEKSLRAERFDRRRRTKHKS